MLSLAHRHAACVWQANFTTRADLRTAPSANTMRSLPFSSTCVCGQLLLHASSGEARTLSLCCIAHSFRGWQRLSCAATAPAGLTRGRIAADLADHIAVAGIFVYCGELFLDRSAPHDLASTYNLVYIGRSSPWDARHRHTSRFRLSGRTYPVLAACRIARALVVRHNSVAFFLTTPISHHYLLPAEGAETPVYATRSLSLFGLCFHRIWAGPLIC